MASSDRDEISFLPFIVCSIIFHVKLIRFSDCPWISFGKECNAILIADNDMDLVSVDFD